MKFEAADGRGQIIRMAKGKLKWASSLYTCRVRFLEFSACFAVLAAILLAPIALRSQEESQAVDDMTAKYHFLSADDTLEILDEEGMLKGDIEVSQPDDESDDVLTYDIVEGTRQKSHVKFRTNIIHGKLYRFSGTVERGKGHEEKDPDYFRLIGDVDVVTVNPDTHKESVQTFRVNLKSFGKSERPDD